MDSSHEKITPYNPDWVTKYSNETDKLKSIFGDSFIAIEHIGSTSIPDLSSKPIIDIAVLIRSHTEAEEFIEPLSTLGYRFDKEFHAKTQFPERHFFRKGNPTELHLSVAYADKAKFWPRQIVFRDWLRSNPIDRERYQTLKEKLIQEDPSGTASYIGGKSEFIQEILEKAGFN